MIQLPDAIAAFVKAQNAEDVDAMVACFTDDAEVHDESQTYRGIDEITKWVEESFQKAKFQIQPTKISHTDPDVVMTSSVTGDFDGTELQHTFLLEGDKVADLEIH